MDCLFVYGTLRSDMGHPMHEVLDFYARLIGLGIVPGRLFNLGEYPGLVLINAKEFEASSKAECIAAVPNVWGEVYALKQITAQILLEILDDYEGYNPDQISQSDYRREKVQVHMESTTAIAPATLDNPRSLEAWVYVYNQDVAAYPELPSGNYADYV